MIDADTFNHPINSMKASIVRTAQLVHKYHNGRAGTTPLVTSSNSSTSLTVCTTMFDAGATIDLLRQKFETSVVELKGKAITICIFLVGIRPLPINLKCHFQRPSLFRRIGSRGMAERCFGEHCR
jgi:hypothetical protein